MSTQANNAVQAIDFKKIGSILRLAGEQANGDVIRFSIVPINARFYVYFDESQDPRGLEDNQELMGDYIELQDAERCVSRLIRMLKVVKIINL